MPASGQTIHNPVTGESITFLRTDRDTSGQRVALAFSVTPGGAPPAPHVHPRQSETFALHAGRCRVIVDGRERELGPGDVLTVPRGASHTWAALDQTRMTVTLEPALRADEFFEELFALANAGKVNSKGLPTPLHFAVLLDDYRDLVYLAVVPARVQKAMMALLAPIGRALGRGAKRLPRRVGNLTPPTPATL